LRPTKRVHATYKSQAMHAQLSVTPNPDKEVGYKVRGGEALDACKAIPFQVVVVCELFTGFTSPLCEDAHSRLTADYPFLCSAIRVAGMIQVPGPVSPLCCIYQQSSACRVPLNSQLLCSTVPGHVDEAGSCGHRMVPRASTEVRT
jgi:hypothetical protein